MNTADREIIPAGARIHLIKSNRGSYIRTPDGKFYSIRQSTSTVNNSPKPVPIAPPPPPPPSSLLDELLFGTKTKPNFIFN
jgi:hypothetical protein